jgi:hypothetical protein
MGVKTNIPNVCERFNRGPREFRAKPRWVFVIAMSEPFDGRRRSSARDKRGFGLNRQVEVNPLWRALHGIPLS